MAVTNGNCKVCSSRYTEIYDDDTENSGECCSCRRIRILEERVGKIYERELHT